MKLSRLIKIATGILLIVTFVLQQQTVFALYSSPNYKLYGQLSPIVEQSDSSLYELESGGIPAAGEISSSLYKIQQGTIYSHLPGVTTPTPPSGSPLPIISGGGGGGGSGVSAEPTAEVGIIDLEFTEMAPDSVKIVFNTDDLAVAHLQYSGDEISLDSLQEFALKLQHEFILEDLTPGTTYKFIIKLRDVYFNVTESGEYSFTTPELDYKYFIDVENEEWYAEYVNTLADEGCLETTSDYYYPADDLTRGQAVKLLVCMGNLKATVPAAPTFKDVPRDHWGYQYVEIASALGVVDGYSGSREGYFGPEDPITREQFAKMITETFDLEIWDNCTTFPDFGSISNWACEYVGTSYAWSVIDGYPDSSFGPKRNINRAEGAKMIVNGANPVLREGIDLSKPEQMPEEEIIEEEVTEEEIVEEEEEVIEPPESEEEVVEIELEIGPGGELDYGLVDETTDDTEDLSDVMEYLLDVLQQALEGE